VLDTGARGSLTTFAQAERGIGRPVMLSRGRTKRSCDEAARQGQVRDRRAVAQHPRRAAGRGLDKVAIRRGTTVEARAYLEYLYSKEARRSSRGTTTDRVTGGCREVLEHLPKVNLVNIADFGGWAKAQSTHFADGGTFDRSTPADGPRQAAPATTQDELPRHHCRSRYHVAPWRPAHEDSRFPVRLVWVAALLGCLVSPDARAEVTLLKRVLRPDA